MNFVTLTSHCSQIFSTSMLLAQKITSDPRFNIIVEFGRFADDLSRIAVALLS
ncbi:MAG: hypothetical protein AAB776_04395 [Patescibacteria group bacterium]